MNDEKRQKILDYLSGYRLEHTLGCEKEAVKLSKRWGEDEEKCRVAALFHDITKNLSFNKQLQLCEEYGIIIDKVEMSEPKLLHGKTAAEIARRQFRVGDDVYSAVSVHTTGKANMTLIEKIIYIADYIEETRSFDGVQTARELAYQDIDGALMYCFETSITDLVKRHKLIHRDSIDALNFLNERFNSKVFL